MTSSYNNDEELGRLKEEEDKKINEEYKDITDPKDPGDLLTPENLYNRLNQSIENPIQYDKPEPNEDIKRSLGHSDLAKMSLIGTLPGEKPTTTAGQDYAFSLLPDLRDPKEASEFFVDLRTYKNPIVGFGANIGKALIKDVAEDLGPRLIRWINRTPPTGLAAVTDTGDLFRIPWDSLSIDYDKFIRTKQLFPTRYNMGSELDSPGDWADAQTRIDLPSKNPGPEADWTDVATELKNDVDFQNIWGKDVDSAADKLDEAVNYARRNSDQGYTLKGYNNEFYDQNGVKFKVVRIKNTPVNLKEGFGYQLVPEINYQQARMIRRHREAVPLQEVISYVRELRPEWSDARILDVAKKYKKYVTDGNKALTRVSQAWNKSLGGPFMSIDHIKDLKSGGRNIPTNRRLFPKIPNSAKNATQLYADEVLTAIGARWNLKEDVAAFIDPDIAGFWKFIDEPKKTQQLINMTANGWNVNDAINMIEQGIGTSMNPTQYRTYISKTAGKGSVPLPEYPHKPPKPEF